MKKKVIAYVHSHWDREWYREYEIFRMRLLRVFDNVLNMLENNTLPSFYFDGQTSALLDYLEIRPENEALIRKFIKEKRLFIGPFYCLVDEFLTDETCFRKNIELGLKTAKEYGCEDFTAYFADTFGHSASTIPILKEYGIETAIVWRGLGDVPSEFIWKQNETDISGINTINLIRGYFNDAFSSPMTIEKKAELLKTNLDKIAEKSGDVLLLPIGADHLGIEPDLSEQIHKINTMLNDYEIYLGSIFDYISSVKDRFSEYEIIGELRDNSKTFILEGCYSSRLDIKKYNTIACHKLDKANKLGTYTNSEKYIPLIDYAYKLLIQNQAHDSICGCSTNDVHFENILRYKKILQISDNIIDEIGFEKKFNNTIINLADKNYKGSIEFKSAKSYPYQVIKTEKGFSKNLLVDTQKIPITEDYTDIKTYCVHVNAKEGTQTLSETIEGTDVFVTDNCIGNSNIFFTIKNNEMRIGNNIIKILDYKDEGDSYNTGFIEGDIPVTGEIMLSKAISTGNVRSILGVDIKVKDDILHLEISLDKESPLLHFHIEWENNRKNHLLQVVIDTGNNIETTLSEDFENIIERKFDSNFDVRKNLPKTKGLEVKTNTAPMHRGVYANGIGIVTEGITQYEVYKKELKIPILRATGIISNPKNPSRTTPAGPPIIVSDCQMTGHNTSDFWVFQGNDLKKMIDSVFHKCLIMCE